MANNSATDTKNTNIFIAACYGELTDDGMPHITIRKGNFYPDNPETSSLKGAAEIVEQHLSSIIDQCPKTFVCKEHAWKKEWWAGPGFMGAHKYLLKSIKFTEDMPYWLEKDIKNSKNPDLTRQIYESAISKYGTPWDGEDCFHMIAHMTKVKNLHKPDDKLNLTYIAVFLGKTHRGQLLPETPHFLFKVD